jgi:hypothetical protein
MEIAPNTLGLKLLQFLKLAELLPLLSPSLQDLLPGPSLDGLIPHKHKDMVSMGSCNSAKILCLQKIETDTRCVGE